MPKPTYEFSLWSNCNNNCLFCKSEVGKDTFPGKLINLNQTIRPIVLARKFTEALCINTPGSNVLFTGGELFDRKLPKESVKAFYRLTQTCIDMIQDGSLEKVYINTNFIYEDTSLLFGILDKFKKNNLEHKVHITTYYDLGYRYKNQADLWTATMNMREVSNRYPTMVRTARMIMTIIAYDILTIEPLILDNFFYDTSFSLYLSPYIKGDADFSLTRNEHLTFLFSLKEYYPDILHKIINDIDSHSSEKLFDYNGHRFVMKNQKFSPCGHKEHFRRVYKDSDSCFLCDLKKLALVEK